MFAVSLLQDGKSDFIRQSRGELWNKQVKISGRCVADVMPMIGDASSAIYHSVLSGENLDNGKILKSCTESNVFPESTK